MIVIGLIGPKAAGKDSIGSHIVKKYGGKKHSHSETLDEILHVLRIPNTRENVIRLVALRKNFGDDVLINALNKKIKLDHTDIIVVTGIRFENEFKNIRSYPKNAIIYVNAPPEQRYQRQSNRNYRADDPTMSYEEFLSLEKRETEIHIHNLGEKADFKILNTCSEQELFAKVDDIIKKIL